MTSSCDFERSVRVSKKLVRLVSNLVFAMRFIHYTHSSKHRSNHELISRVSKRTDLIVSTLCSSVRRGLIAEIKQRCSITDAVLITAILQ